MGITYVMPEPPFCIVSFFDNKIAPRAQISSRSVEHGRTDVRNCSSSRSSLSPGLAYRRAAGIISVHGPKCIEYDCYVFWVHVKKIPTSCFRLNVFRLEKLNERNFNDIQYRPIVISKQKSY